MGEVALATNAAPEALADATIEALLDNGYGQYDGLIEILAPVLRASGLAHLKERIETLASMPVPVPPKGEWEAIGYGSHGTTYAHEMAESSRQSTVRMALMDIADAEGDADAFIGQYDAKTRKVPAIAAEIAERLLAAGRAEDAWGFIERAEFGSRGWVPSEWQSVRLDVLEAPPRFPLIQCESHGVLSGNRFCPKILRVHQVVVVPDRLFCRVALLHLC